MQSTLLERGREGPGIVAWSREHRRNSISKKDAAELLQWDLKSTLRIVLMC